MKNDKITHDAQKLVYEMMSSIDSVYSKNTAKKCAMISIDFALSKIRNYDEPDLCVLTRDQARYDKECLTQLKKVIENI